MWVLFDALLIRLDSVLIFQGDLVASHSGLRIRHSLILTFEVWSLIDNVSLSVEILFWFIICIIIIDLNLRLSKIHILVVSVYIIAKLYLLFIA